MKFIEADYEILNPPDPRNCLAVMKHLERIGRICYKSEERITGDSCIKFINNIRNRGHWAMLEHYIFILSIPQQEYYDITSLADGVNEDNPDLAEKMRYIHYSEWTNVPNEEIDFRYIVSGSATAFNYLLQCKRFRSGGCHAINRIAEYIHRFYPELIAFPDGYEFDPSNRRHCDRMRFIGRDEMKKLPVGLRKIHDFLTIKFYTDRGVTHEDVRHRPASWAMESTRYCNYGGYGCTFIIPVWFSERGKTLLLDDDAVNDMIDKRCNIFNMDEAEYIWFRKMEDDNRVYSELRLHGWSPQMCRTVLPHAVKAELVMTANPNELIHYFNMRIPATAHPQMRELAIPMLRSCYVRDPEVYAECMHLLEE